MTRQICAFASLVLVLGSGGAASGAPARADGYRIIYSFQSKGDGDDPWAGLFDVGGTLYGTTFGGGSGCKSHGLDGCGTVFSLDPATGIETVLFEFRRGRGTAPLAGLIEVGGSLYGTTSSGGTADDGTAFAFKPSKDAERVVYSFQGGSDGRKPEAGLTEVGGSLFGANALGGSSGNGTVFSLNARTGGETVVYSFQGGADGALPQGTLINVGDILYGTASIGGLACDISGGCGTVFSVNAKTGAKTTVYSFRGGNDGGYPIGGLINLGGTLYGTTYLGGGTGCAGSQGCGTVFSLKPQTGTETVVHSFQGGDDGAWAYSSLIKVGGKLYGTTPYGGSGVCNGYGCGTVFSLDLKTGAEKVMYSFQGGSDGADPFATPIDVGGTLYGTTAFGGGTKSCRDGCGTVFAIMP